MKLKVTFKRAALPALLSILNSQPSTLRAQGSLTPPGAPAPTFKTLQQIEPRTPISAVPFTITNAGAYYLTTSLTGNPGGIIISASGVTLDLMGFELVGGTGDGIFVSGFRSNNCIRNGVLRNWDSSGVLAPQTSGSQFEQLRLSRNDFAGLQTGPDCTVIQVIAMGNARFGIQVGSGSLIKDCIVSANTSNGIQSNANCVIRDCVVQNNGGHGINDGGDSTVESCLVAGNAGSGIRLASASRMRNCSVSFSTGDGIAMAENCSVVNNTSESNDGAGIHATADGNRIESNDVSFNGRGIVVDGLNNVIIRNIASDNSGTNYLIGAGNALGPTNNLVGGGIITNVNPWVNFSF